MNRLWLYVWFEFQHGILHTSSGNANFTFRGDPGQGLPRASHYRLFIRLRSTYSVRDDLQTENINLFTFTRR